VNAIRIQRQSVTVQQSVMQFDTMTLSAYLKHPCQVACLSGGLKVSRKPRHFCRGGRPHAVYLEALGAAVLTIAVNVGGLQ
jgi:hypothetical protein